MTGQIPSKRRRSSGLQLQKQHSSPSAAFMQRVCSSISGDDIVLLVYSLEREAPLMFTGQKKRMFALFNACLSVMHHINGRLFFLFFLSCVSICFHSGFLSVTLQAETAAHTVAFTTVWFKYLPQFSRCEAEIVPH